MSHPGQEQKEIHRLTFSLSHPTRDDRQVGPSESPFDLPPSGKPPKPEWVSHGRSSHLESVATSLWSWLVVGILSAWFSIWLLEAISRLGARLP